MKRFTGRSAVVTGASSGLGKALAIALAQEGAKLLLCARRAEALAETADACAGQAEPMPGDLASEQYCAQLAAHAGKRFADRLDYLVACAGQRQWQSIQDTTPQDLAALVEANYLGTTRILHYLKPLLHGGLVCAITSVQGRIPVPEHAGYAAAKHALDAYLQVLRMEAGMEVLIVRPGWITPASASHGGTIAEQHCVRVILRAMQHRRRELYIPARYRYLPLLHSLLPRTFERVLQRRVRKEARRRGIT